MLQDFVANKRVRLNAVVGLYPAAAVGDDIEVYDPTDDEGRTTVLARLAGLRQQAEKDSGEPYYCLSDFVAPRGSGVPDYVGMFACSAGGCWEAKAEEGGTCRSPHSANLRLWRGVYTVCERYQAMSDA